VARRLFASGLWQIALGGLLGLLHVYSVSHYFWPTDGIFLVTGILIAGAILAFLQALRTGGFVWLIVTLVCTALALLTREDSITVYPLLLWFGAGCVLVNPRAVSNVTVRKTHLVLFAAAMLVALGGYWYWRSVAVPSALPLKVEPLALLWGALMTVQNVGGTQVLASPWPAYSLLILLWDVWLVVMLVGAVFTLKGRARLIVLFWAGAALLAALPVLVVARTNLLLLPAAFWGQLVAHVLVELWRSPRLQSFRILSGALTLFALAAPAFGSFAFQQELRPNNLNWMCRNADLLYGVVGNATIPAARRESVQLALANFGITDLDSFKTSWRALDRKAQAEGRFGVNLQGLPFIPRFEFLPQFGLHPYCEPPR
jgi:hypothetical protein